MLAMFKTGPKKGQAKGTGKVPEGGPGNAGGKDSKKVASS
jgi:hypothetical protein